MSARLREVRKERGVVLMISLIALVAMSLVGIALVRSVDMGNIIAGNLAFKQGATQSGDFGIERARQWLLGAGANLLIADSPGVGYFANWQTGSDLTGNNPAQADFNWDANAVRLARDPVTGNEVRYVVHRMCRESNKSVVSTDCIVVTLATGTGGSGLGQSKRGGGGQTDAAGLGDVTAGGGLVYYRVTVRIDGPRNTRSFVQAMLY